MKRFLWTLVIALIPNAASAGGWVEEALRSGHKLFHRTNPIANALFSIEEKGRIDPKEIGRSFTDAAGNTFTIVAEPLDGICAQPFYTVADMVVEKCSKYKPTQAGSNIIERIIDLLIDERLVGREVFNNVAIRFCPFSKEGIRAEGIAPRYGRIYLDEEMKKQSDIGLAVLLRHEMKHIEQYRRLGRSRFACKYSSQLIGSGGSQGRDHEMEREAYEAGDVVAQHFIAKHQQSARRERCLTTSFKINASDGNTVSVTLGVTNDCAEPVDIKVCYERMPLHNQLECQPVFENIGVGKSIPPVHVTNYGDNWRYEGRVAGEDFTFTIP